MSLKIDTLLNSYVDRRAFPGAAYCYGTATQIHIGFVGRHEYASESRLVDAATMYDLASVTKVMATTASAMIAVQKGLLEIDRPVKDYLPETKLGDATVRNLLLHNCGIKAYESVTKMTDAGEARIKLLASDPPKKPGESTVYSCLGFVSLMTIIERIAGQNLAAFAETEFFKPLGIDACFCPSPGLVPLCAPTEETPAWRREMARMRGEEWTIGKYIQGSVHDPIAYVLGGLSGNAGMFSTIDGVARFGQALAGEHEIFGGLIPEWIKRDGDATRALGFDTKSAVGSSSGTKFGARSYGHTGYTGTCIWVDPDAKIFAALLSNRVHPKDGDLQISKARPQYFDLAFEAATS